MAVASPNGVTEARERVSALGYDYDAQPKELTECPVCEVARDRSMVGSRDRYGFKVSFWLCEGCGVIFLSPRMTPEGYDDFYQNWYRPIVNAYARPGEFPKEAVRRGRIQHNADMISTLSRWITPAYRKRTLDIGGGDGQLMTQLHDTWGHTCTVLEPCLPDVESALLAGHEAYVGTAEDISALAGREYDTVFMIQTIDHLLEPMLAFRNVRSLISEYGVFVVDIVDWQGLYGRLQDKDASFKIDHPLNWTLTALKVLAQKTGFELLGSAEDGKQIVCVYRPVPRLGGVRGNPVEIAELVERYANKR